MCKFLSLVIDRAHSRFANTEYLSNVVFLYLRYSKFLNDDYAPEANYSNILSKIESCGGLFYIVLNSSGSDFAGFIYIDNLIGNADEIHGGEITACFEKKYWGKFTKTVADQFFDYCFNTLKLKKIKAQIYPFNSRVRAILKYSGFKKDGVLRGETMKNGRLSDVEVYSLLAEDRKFVRLTG